MTVSFAKPLLAWYDRERRDLPWRRTRDPWAIWVSEVMLQQTRVEVVVDAWQRFVARFPTPDAWARASDDELLAAWKGLGYYRRARLLRMGAREVAERHGGRVPRDVGALAELPGIGEYTRGAVASIAFGIAVPAIDGNVERVMARQFAIDGDISRGPGRRRVRALAREHLDPDRPGDFNQALMDLGATVCTPRNPACGACPLGASCAARRSGIERELPRLRARPRPIRVHARAVVIRGRGERLVAHRIGPGEINEGQLELPGPGILVDHPAAGGALERRLAERFGGRYVVGDELARVAHAITNHRITLSVHACRVPGRRPGKLLAARADDAAWCTPSRKAIAAIGQ